MEYDRFHLHLGDRFPETLERNVWGVWIDTVWQWDKLRCVLCGVGMNEVVE